MRPNGLKGERRMGAKVLTPPPPLTQKGGERSVNSNPRSTLDKGGEGIGKLVKRGFGGCKSGGEKGGAAESGIEKRWKREGRLSARGRGFI